MSWGMGGDGMGAGQWGVGHDISGQDRRPKMLFVSSSFTLEAFWVSLAGSWGL